MRPAARLAAALGAVCLALWLADFGLTYRTAVASGSDPYGYVSQSALWARGNLHVPQPAVAEMPWPDAEFTASPLGYRPAADDPKGAIVPVYSPGVSIVMAVAARLAGPAAVYWVVPLFAALFVIATYGIGLRLIGRPAVALAAAGLVALSPTTVFMSMWPMADLAAAACWAAATWALLGPSRRAAAIGGLSVAAAVMIRPNLIGIGLAMGLWAIARDIRRGAPRWRVDRAALFAAGAAPGVLAIMAINDALHGSPFTSGYGTLTSVLSLSRIPANAVRYGMWFVDSQTVLACIGLLPLALPLARVWGGDARARDARLLSVVAAATLLSYLTFASLDEWWYLRFLLPMWPGVFIGLASFCLPEWAPDSRRRWSFWVRAIAGVAVIATVGWWSLRVAEQHRFTATLEGERRFITAAQLVRDHTPPGSVVYGLTHTGSVRYYGERMTLKFDALDPAWLDRSVDWFAARGAHPYALLETWEVAYWRERFGAQGARGQLAVAPVLEVNWPTHYWLYDLASTTVPASWPVIGYEQPRVPADVPPGPAPSFMFR